MIFFSLDSNFKRPVPFQPAFRMSFSLTEFLESGAVMSSGEKLLIGWGKKTGSAAPEHDRERPLFYFNDFFLTKPLPWVRYSNHLRVSPEEMHDLLGDVSAGPPIRWEFLRRRQFKETFYELKKKIGFGRLHKAVPYIFSGTPVRMTRSLLAFSLKKALESLKTTKKMLYGYWGGGSGMLGLTPELLFYHAEDRPNLLSTMALAGTCSLDSNENEFLTDQKECREHRFVVEGICRELKQIGAVSTGEMQVLRLPSLAHLFTPIEILLKRPFRFDDIVRRMHPTPALGAFPKREGTGWLKEYAEHTPRNNYGAPSGFIDSKEGIAYCMAGIRNIQWNASGMRIGAGCGVIAESLFENEWKEIQLKTQVVREQFGL